MQYLSEGGTGANMDGAHTFFMQLMSGPQSFVTNIWRGAHFFKNPSCVHKKIKSEYNRLKLFVISVEKSNLIEKEQLNLKQNNLIQCFNIFLCVYAFNNHL